MSELISGKEALIALANGEEVEIRFKNNLACGWYSCNTTKLQSIDTILNHENEFRIKPKPILLNGVEIPPTFTPKEGEVFYYIDLEYPDSYNYRKYKSGFPHFCEHLIKLGAWKTEDEIKQVVEVLRGMFNGKS